MVVSLGCEKLQPERLLPPGVIPIVDERNVSDIGINADPQLDVVVLQSEHHVGFDSMIESIMDSAYLHLERLNDRRRETVPASELVVGVQCGGSDAFSGAFVHQLTNAAGQITDHRYQTVAHGLDQTQRQTLIVRRQEKDIVLRQEPGHLRVVNFPSE